MSEEVARAAADRALIVRLITQRDNAEHLVGELRDGYARMLRERDGAREALTTLRTLVQAWADATRALEHGPLDDRTWSHNIERQRDAAPALRVYVLELDTKARM